MATKIGRPSLCGNCGHCRRCKRAAYMRQRWAGLTPEQKRAATAHRDPDRTREQDRRKMARRRLHGTAEQKQKIAARDAVRLAILGGHLKRLPCEVCGAAHAHAHHEDYDKPLDVRWLCRRHHEQLHGLVEA